MIQFFKQLFFVVLEFRKLVGLALQSVNNLHVLETQIFSNSLTLNQLFFIRLCQFAEKLIPGPFVFLALMVDLLGKLGVRLLQVLNLLLKIGFY